MSETGFVSTAEVCDVGAGVESATEYSVLFSEDCIRCLFGPRLAPASPRRRRPGLRGVRRGCAGAARHGRLGASRAMVRASRADATPSAAALPR